MPTNLLGEIVIYVTRDKAEKAAIITADHGDGFVDLCVFAAVADLGWPLDHQANKVPMIKQGDEPGMWRFRDLDNPAEHPVYPAKKKA